ncbi:MAG: hypothetical protein J6A19_14650 [Oscillospiraceae bacterium]|nr:hypothetical protein [Oscillospiraceae bacterium]
MGENTDVRVELAEVSAICHKHEGDISEIKDEIKDIKDEQKSIHEIAFSVRTIAEQTKDIKTEVKEIKSEQATMRGDISELKNAPVVADADKWKKAVTYIGTALGGAVVSYILSVLFPLLVK